MRTAILTAAVVLIGAAACTESGRARNDATFSDKPADITCWSYGTVTYQGRSTGKVSNREGACPSSTPPTAATPSSMASAGWSTTRAEASSRVVGRRIAA